MSLFCSLPRTRRALGAHSRDRIAEGQFSYPRLRSRSRRLRRGCSPRFLHLRACAPAVKIPQQLWVCAAASRARGTPVVVNISAPALSHSRRFRDTYGFVLRARGTRSCDDRTVSAPALPQLETPPQLWVCAAASRYTWTAENRFWHRSRDSAAAIGLCCSLPRSRHSCERASFSISAPAPTSEWVCAAASRARGSPMATLATRFLHAGRPAASIAVLSTKAALSRPGQRPQWPYL